MCIRSIRIDVALISDHRYLISGWETKILINVISYSDDSNAMESISHKWHDSHLSASLNGLSLKKVCLGQEKRSEGVRRLS